jgi:hypothetical protein
MKILVGKTFGLGNAVLALPMVKALCTLGEVTVLVGQTPDDVGAADVFQSLYRSAFCPRNFKGVTTSAKDGHYDVAVMSIPFDGRWKNGVDFHADRVLDCRKRPGNVERLGFDMWEKHEVLYQMENATELGYEGPAPNSTFFSGETLSDDLVYLGIGYKRDSGGFGRSKHFGTDSYAELMQAIRSRHAKAKFISTGSGVDFFEVGSKLTALVGDRSLYCHDPAPGFAYAFRTVANCSAYIGNDTGMMHVAAARDLPTHGIFISEDLIRKNRPWATEWRASLLTDSVDKIADVFVEMVWGKK